MSKDYILISTDLEPDDVSFLRIFLKELNNKYEGSEHLPQVHILVGEGAIPRAKVNKVKEILEALVDDKILIPSFLKNIEVLGGSSVAGGSDNIHQFFNENCFNASSTFTNNDHMREESIKKITQAIKGAKLEGGKVTIFGLKPLTDIPDIIEQTDSVLEATDELLLSGSYNFRTVSDDSERLNYIINEGKYKTTVFESFFTYDQNKLPKVIMHLEEADNYSSILNKLTDSIKDNSSERGSMHKFFLEVWNKAVSNGCMQSCLNDLLSFKEEVEDFNYELLEDFLSNLQISISDSSKSIDQINKEFIETINNSVFNGESILTGRERFVEDYNTDFAEKFPDLCLNNFNMNWKILGFIAHDPYEMLIGDATLGVYYFHPELFETIEAQVICGRDSFTSFKEGEAENTFLISNIIDYEGFLKVLGCDLIGEDFIDEGV